LNWWSTGAHLESGGKMSGFNGGSGLDGEYLVQAALTYRSGILKMVLPCLPASLLLPQLLLN
jgi:hypothetical protein